MAGERNHGWPGFFRTFAVFAALMLLLAQSGQELVGVSSGAWQVLSIYEGLTRWSIPALFMGWGMCALEGGGKASLRGSLLGLALPAFCMLVFWGALYAVVSHLLGGGTLTLGGVWDALASAARGNTYFHLWILYPLIGLYLVHPLLQRFASSASRGEILYILALALLFAGVLPVWASFHPNWALTALLERFQVHMVLGYMGYYLAGWYLRHFVIGRAAEFLLYLLGVLGLVVTLAGPSLIGGGRELWYSNTAPGVPGGVRVRGVPVPPALGPGIPVVRGLPAGSGGGGLGAGVHPDLFSAVPALRLAVLPDPRSRAVADGVTGPVPRSVSPRGFF